MRTTWRNCRKQGFSTCKRREARASRQERLHADAGAAQPCFCPDSPNGGCDGELWWIYAALLEFDQDFSSTLGGFPGTVLDGQKLFLATFIDSYDDQGTPFVLLGSQARVDPVRPNADPVVFLQRCVTPVLTLLGPFCLEAENSTRREILGLRAQPAPSRLLASQLWICPCDKATEVRLPGISTFSHTGEPRQIGK